MDEIVRAIRWIETEGNHAIIPLHCVLSYPTSSQDANLGYIKYLDSALPYPVGYSCHVVPIKGMPHVVWAWLFGAKIIEKHFTLDKNLPGNDHYHAMDYHDLKRVIEKMKFIRRIIGKFEKHYLPSEEISRKYARRSLVAKRHIPKGKLIEKEDITWKRPGTGIPPWMIDFVIGGVALKDIEEDEVLDFNKIRLNAHNSLKY